MSKTVHDHIQKYLCYLNNFNKGDNDFEFYHNTWGIFDQYNSTKLEFPSAPRMC